MIAGQTILPVDDASHILIPISPPIYLMKEQVSFCILSRYIAYGAVRLLQVDLEGEKVY
jgi:hypothetical protein